jgi:hypothetical protein
MASRQLREEAEESIPPGTPFFLISTGSDARRWEVHFSVTRLPSIMAPNEEEILEVVRIGIAPPMVRRAKTSTLERKIPSAETSPDNRCRHGGVFIESICGQRRDRSNTAKLL